MQSELVLRSAEHTHTYTQIHTHAQTHRGCGRTFMYAHTQGLRSLTVERELALNSTQTAHTHVHTYIHTHTYTHIHIHTQTRAHVGAVESCCRAQTCIAQHAQTAHTLTPPRTPTHTCTPRGCGVLLQQAQTAHIHTKTHTYPLSHTQGLRSLVAERELALHSTRELVSSLELQLLHSVPNVRYPRSLFFR